MSAPTATRQTRVSPPHSSESNSGSAKVKDEYQQAREYWGYLFKADKTGTDRLKALLAGLKNEINKIYDPSDCPDLTPVQLAGFYRDLHGNYDQLFLATPSESIAFIYKSLGCLHSLQPERYGQSTAFTDPTVPALKTEGWAMWQTIQLLLGPDEHAGFLSEAVQKWDITDPTTGERFPKLLPRECFPMEPDKHMVAWYEGVSERLRKEAEDEERQREIEAEQVEVRRIRDTAHGPKHDDDEAGSQDSRGPALAYFRNPLYRHVDGRPSIVRRNSRRPASSPRPNGFVDKGKEAASTFGHVVRNIGSPHLWDGRRTRHGSESRERRRRSVPEHHLDGASPSSHGGTPATSPYEHHHRRNRSAHGSHGSRSDRLGPESDNVEGISPGWSPRPTSSRHSRKDSREPSLRRPRSHDPTPYSPKEPDDYFQGFDKAEQPPRRNSAHGSTISPPANNAPVPNANLHANAPPPPGTNAGFGPSASPLFATHIARQPQPVQAPNFGQTTTRVTSNESHRKPNNHNFRRPQDRYDSRSPARRDYDDPRRRYDSPRRPRPERPDYDDDHDSRRHRRSGSELSYSGPEDRDWDRDRDRDRDRDIERYGGDRRDRPPPRQTRFAPAVQGVDGRRYPDAGPWR